MMRIAWLALLVCLSAGGIQAQTADAPLQVDLDIRALAGPLRDLNPEEEQAVEEAIELIRHGEHTLALLSLARLTGRNPNNSALRVLRAYVLLQLGNSLGALDDARAAESGRIRSAYRCWFLAQVAYAAGDRPLCKREARHLAGNPSYGRKTTDLARKLAARTK